MLALLLVCAQAPAQYRYPATKIADSSNTYFGITYHDHYQWLEDLNDSDVTAWFREQAAFTDSVLGNISGRKELLAEFQMLNRLHPEKLTDRVYAGGRLFYKKTIPADRVAKLYYRSGFQGQEQLLFDPMTYIPGKILTIQSIAPSFDGKQIAIAYTSAGAEVSTVKIMDIASKTFLRDELFPVYSINSWTFDNKALLYVRLRSANNADPNSRLDPGTWLHTVGTDSSQDIDFFSNSSYPDLKMGPQIYPIASLTEQNKNYIYATKMSVQREVNAYYAPIDQFNSGKIQWKVMCTAADNLVRGAVFWGDRLFAITYRDAKNFKLIETDIKHPDWQHATTVIPEKSDQTLQSVVRCKDYLLLTYNDGINSHIYKYQPVTGKLSPIVPPVGGIAEVSCVDITSNTCVVNITSWMKPPTEFDLDASTDVFSASTINKPAIYPEAFSDLTVKEVEVTGHDGAQIPLSIIYRKGTKLDGNHVCIMESYGAYGISITPDFDFRDNYLATLGVVVAIAHVRGGSEKGEAWYKGGFKATKPNTWKDFNNCAEYLIAQGWTKPSKLAANAGSAGGILISRAITERPDLYAAVICNVGIANAMRAEFSANGPANIPEFGTVKDSLECRGLYEMDGMQHVVKGTKYPAVLCIAGWNDSRVAPWEPGKFAAALQNASASDRPILMKVNYNSGHTTEDKLIGYQNLVDQMAFYLWQCGQPGFETKQKNTPIPLLPNK